MATTVKSRAGFAWYHWLLAPLRSFALLACCFSGAPMLREANAQVVRPIAVPGRIEAEYYDTNGPGSSYYDDSPGNAGNIYRNDDVDIESTTDVGGGYDVGWIGSGE